ncbi:hypothetical protein [Brytella acorum]|uniref:Uncharacterized protein n=1 Tax=Brytella acorum TaxID=2959299 RepID=A0AA35USB0_9PROT|nr:hypothetical protein [Brytella acorum]MDF3626235.1 hypothetical protein [Brytella acorum]CAI9121271.1 hypothetical protein LMG32879_002118 [Brytella acorum]
MRVRDIYYQTPHFRSKKINQYMELPYTYHLYSILTLALFFNVISEAKAENITFAQAAEAAWSLDPGRTELNTNYHSASVRVEAARSWFAGAPTVVGQYFDDHAIGTNEGYTTYQGGVSVPLWLPG